MTDTAHDREGRPFDLELAGMIDHTLLRPEAQAQQIRELCREASAYRFAAVCIHPMWVALAAETLNASAPGAGAPGRRPPVVCTVVGFPQGAQSAEVKAFEAAKAAQQGAREIDMVIPIGALKDGDLPEVGRHIEQVVQACRGRALVKVIIETCLLTGDEKREACRIAAGSGAAFVKTSTGFSSGGATEADVQLMRQTVGPDFGVKAAGGIRDHEGAWRMIRAGATRIGTSCGIKLVLPPSS